MAKVTIESLERALRKNHGLVTQAAKALKVDRGTVYNFMNNHPEVDWEAIRRDSDAELVDVAEGHLQTALKGGDMKTIRWYLERKGKDRGYTTRQELTGEDGTPLVPTEIRREIVDPKEQEEPHE